MLAGGESAGHTRVYSSVSLIPSPPPPSPPSSPSWLRYQSWGVPHAHCLATEDTVTGVVAMRATRGRLVALQLGSLDLAMVESAECSVALCIHMSHATVPSCRAAFLVEPSRGV